MSTTTSQTPTEYHAALRRRERWWFWRRAALIVAAVAVTVVVALWANGVAQKYIILGDDTARGERFRESLIPVGQTSAERERYVADQCRTAAEAFYGHRITYDSLLKDDGHAAPDEKAFFHACSGWTVGGHGGGGSD